MNGTSKQYGSLECESLLEEDRSNNNVSGLISGFPRAPAPLLLALSGFFLLIVAGSSLSSHQSSVPLDASLTSLEGMPFAPPGHLPDDALFYQDQLVDHFVENDKETWPQRYYATSEYFAGPGNPIFMIMGGEGPLEGFLYPFVTQHLAKQFNAFVLQPEHRFYGRSDPLKGATPTNEALKEFLTPQQAIEDAVRLLRHIKSDKLGCSMDRSSPLYCPVITVGGSYPGFLAAMMRFVHPELVDIGYASSAPLMLYSHLVPQEVYYDVVTKSAERSVPGCASAVRQGLESVKNTITPTPDSELGVTFKYAAARMGVCVDKIPAYIDSNGLFRDELLMVVTETFADYNMGNYPPTQTTDLAIACKLFLRDDLTAEDKVKSFLLNLVEDIDEDGYVVENDEDGCFDMQSVIPPGANGTVSTSDWSGAGPGPTGFSWEFQLCSLLVVEVGFSEESMFPYRKWTLDWLTEHCQSRFEVTPEPNVLVNQWGFDELVNNGGSRLLFTNGLNDMWSAGSYTTNLTDSIVAINFPNGAHHSDLNHIGPAPRDTDDLREGYVQIAQVLGEWLDEIESERLDAGL